ncbi:MAG: hypothetical protein NXI01_00140 [Gammaproteobacteria bacterium]|nr:hypothetical protein [Gammaproteobacteria bacterium]
MSKKRFFQKSVILAGCLMATQFGFAFSPITPRPCPSVDMLKNFDGDYIESMPMSFDPQTQTMKMTVLQKRAFRDIDGAFARYEKLVFVMSSIAIAQGEEVEDKAQALLSNMQLDADMPFMFRAYKDLVVPVCSYSLPGEDVKAVVMQFPMDADI